MSEEKKGITVSEAGKRGGAVTKAKYGPEHYAAIGKKGGETTAKLGSEHYSRIGKMGGKKGGDQTAARHGSEFYQEIGKKGGEKVRQAFEALREREKGGEK